MHTFHQNLWCLRAIVPPWVFPWSTCAPPLPLPRRARPSTLAPVSRRNAPIAPVRGRVVVKSELRIIGLTIRRNSKLATWIFFWIDDGGGLLFVLKLGLTWFCRFWHIHFTYLFKSGGRERYFFFFVLEPVHT